MLIKLKAKELSQHLALVEKLKTMFSHSKVQAPDACLQGHNGYVWVDDLNSPRVAQIQVGPFHFFAGNSEQADDILDNFNEFMCATVFDDAWVTKLEERCSNRLSKETRHLFARNPDAFDKVNLKQLSETLPPGYEIRPIDNNAIEDQALHGLIPCTGWQYQNAEDFMHRGLGFCMTFEKEIIGAAASFNNYDDGIEVDIAIDGDHRKKGLATALGARLILFCLEKNLYPYWDAANENSLKLATRLGYQKCSEYDSYYIYRFFEDG